MLMQNILSISESDFFVTSKKGLFQLNDSRNGLIAWKQRKKSARTEAQGAWTVQDCHCSFPRQISRHCYRAVSSPPLVPLWWQKTRVSCGSYFGSKKYAKSQSMGRLKCSTQFTMDTTFSPASGPIVSYALLPFDFWFWKGTPHKSHRTNICKDQSTDQFLLTESNHPNFILGCRPDHGVVV